jgi:hypothetical protein
VTHELVRTLAAATASFDSACAALDEAVLALGADGTEGDTVMASPELVALLLRVVVARRDLDCLQEDPPAARPRLAQ